jgi:hypothetical protein
MRGDDLEVGVDTCQCDLEVVKMDGARQIARMRSRSSSGKEARVMGVMMKERKKR